MLKEIAHEILSQKTYDFLRQKWYYFYKTKNGLKSAYRYDLKRYSRYSNSFVTDTETKLIGNIIKAYHVIEKGLTMPEVSLGFGQKKIIELVEYCLHYIRKYREREEQLQHAIQVVLEYKLFHDNHYFVLQNDTIAAIDQLKAHIFNTDACSQIETDKTEYFKYSGSSFPEFSNSRASIRNYTKENIPIERIIEALNLSRKTPSACNRQCWRTYVYTDKNQIGEILNEQGGNRGFGHLANKLIVICSDLSLFTRDFERSQAYIDGGMYAMNVLYALHCQQIAACILNCSNWPEKDIKLRKLCGIKDREVFIAMVACGIPPKNFKVAISKRYKLESTNTIIG